MSADTIAIVKDYADSEDIRVRKNAATAFALIGTDGAMRELVHMALEDNHAEVRNWAAQEISKLPGSLRSAGVSILERALKSPGKRERAYDLLGYLRTLNPTIRPSGSGRATLFVAAIRSGFPSTLSASWRMSRGVIAACIVGTIFGAVTEMLLVSKVLNSTLDGDELSLLLIGASSFSFWLTWLATRRLLPLSVHFDRLVGLIVESLWSGLAGVSAALFIDLAMMGGSGLGARTLASWVLVVAAATFGARLGAVCGSALSLGAFRAPIAMMEALSLGLASAVAMSRLVVDPAAVGPWVLQGLAMLFPAMCGFSAAIALVETRAPASVGWRWQYASLIVILGVTPVAYFAERIVRSRPSNLQGCGVLQADQDTNSDNAIQWSQVNGPVTKMVGIASVPSIVRLKVADRAGVKAALRISEKDHQDYVLELRRVTESFETQVDSWDDPEIGCTVLDAGDYRLVTRLYGGEGRTLSLRQIVPQLFALFMSHDGALSGNPTLKCPSLEITLRSVESASPEQDKECLHDRHIGSSFDPATTIAIPQGKLERGAQVVVEVPKDRRESPVWTSAMDVWANRPMTVASVSDKDNPPQFKVEENSYLWSSHWISDLKSPSLAVPAASTPTASSEP